MILSIWVYLTPLWILLGLLLILGVLALLGRGLKKASQAALERQNPELASAIKKLERAGATRDPQRAQQAMSRLTAAERRAYLDAAGEQTETLTPQMNRQMRRQLERARKRGQR